ncbi:MAG: FAD:protein FMN transferase [Planctomycetota bacterium]
MSSFQTQSLAAWIERFSASPPAYTAEQSSSDSGQSDNGTAQDLADQESVEQASAEQITPFKARNATEALETPESLLQTISRPAMACQFEVLLNQHQYLGGTEAAIAALDRIEELESLFSVYKSRSELSLLNRLGTERAIGLSRETLELLQLANAAHQWTSGAFDVTAGALSEVWGFSRREGKKPTEKEVSRSLETVGIQYVELDGEASTGRMLREGVQVNPGGIGKGYAIDAAAADLSSDGVGDFMLHGGLSSIRAFGDRHNNSTGGGWQVSLKHPLRWEEHLGSIRLRNQALGTSGSGKQFFHFGGKRYSHIIDPRSGWPAQGMMSVTVICGSAAIADILATALFVLGKEQACEFCDANANIGAVLVCQDEKSGSQHIETHNLDKDTWQPR